MGYLDPNKKFPEKYEGGRLVCKVTKLKKTYSSTNQNGMTSRKKHNYFGRSIKPLRFDYLDSLGTIEQLKIYAAKMPNILPNERRKLKPINVR